MQNFGTVFAATNEEAQIAITAILEMEGDSDSDNESHQEELLNSSVIST